MRSSLWSLSLILPLTMPIACGSKKKDKPGEVAPAAPPSTEQTQNTNTGTGTEENKNDKGTSDPNAVYANIYEPTSVPARFSIGMPGAILIETGSALRLVENPPMPSDEIPEEAPDAKEPDQSQSHGLNELRYQMQDISYRIGQFAFDLVALDTLYKTHANCLEAAGCSIPNAEVAMTREMVNYVIAAAGGHDVVPEEDLLFYDDMVGQPWVLGTVTVSHPSDHAHGYTTIATIEDNGEGYNSTRKYGYTADFSKVGIEFDDSGSYSWEDEGGKSNTEKYSYSYKFSYDSTKGTLKIAQDSEFGDGGKWTNEFAFEQDAEKVALNGIKFRVNFRYVGSESDGSSSEMTGLADDNGAYIKTVYAYNVYDYQLTLSAPVTAYGSFNIFPAGTLPADLTGDYGSLSLGSFMADEAGASSWAWYSGPNDIPAGGLEVFEMKWDYNAETEEFSESITDSGANLTAVSRTMTEQKSGYEEIIDAKGTVTSYCYYEGGDFTTAGVCFDSSGQSVGDVSSEYADSFETKVGDDWAPPGYIELGVTGVTLADVNQESLYIFRSVAAMNALAAAYATYTVEDDKAAYPGQLGYGYFVGKGDEDDATAINDIYEFIYWGSANESSSVIVARMTFDAANNFAISFEQVTGAMVTATVAE